MSEATNTKLMDTEPGGEQTQHVLLLVCSPLLSSLPNIYSIDSSSSGQNKKQDEADKSERGEKTAENIRYGEAISEHGFGGETVGNGGKADAADGFGEIEDQSIEGQQRRREQQGYEGAGSGVGG
ncbi:uncharacterized protein LY89DRAFT_721336 [Mollisia scopiformis]|uniref:Uncharacterized protein n=1 Tax=Mollisia scopiformis TaxID=149040 RepID=A0A194X013_MOLSC|nr:uncharacterized protein LY89DRAFT_721336 [Mollisia scopiformis]KUJ13294.1 hypothetical protein LY89DRAFT_721336 [Mollisia scopiformis]